MLKPLSVKLEKNEARLWAEGQVRQFVARLLGDVGGGWPYFTLRVREALVAEAAFAVVRMNYRSDIPVASADCLLSDMLKLTPLMD